MRLTITVPDAVAEQAKALAADTDRSVSSVVATAIARHVAAEQRRRAFDAIDALIGSTSVGANVDDELIAIRSESDRPASALGA